MANVHLLKPGTRLHCLDFRSRLWQLACLRCFHVTICWARSFGFSDLSGQSLFAFHCRESLSIFARLPHEFIAAHDSSLAAEGPKFEQMALFKLFEFEGENTIVALQKVRIGNGGTNP
jgi:hypothetical protein